MSLVESKQPIIIESRTYNLGLRFSSFGKSKYFLEALGRGVLQVVNHEGRFISPNFCKVQRRNKNLSAVGVKVILIFELS